MIVVIGQFRMPAENMDSARPLMEQVVHATRGEPGCVAYNYGEDVLDPGLIRVSEVWRSRAQLDAHMQTAHMATWGRERIALGMSDRAITVFEAGDGIAF